MKILISENHDTLSIEIAKDMIALIKQKPNSLIFIAGGHTPKNVCEHLVNSEQKKDVDFSQCSFVSLDEWVGLDIHTTGSCIETLHNTFFDHISTPSNQIKIFNGKASDLTLEIKKMKKFISSHNIIDIVLLGIGMNGHIGFNEPGIDPNLDFILSPLDPITQEVATKYFDTNINVTEGISLGMKTILNSKNIILMADGSHKSDIIKKSIEGSITNAIPASLLRKNPNLSIYLDKLAASKLRGFI